MSSNDPSAVIFGCQGPVLADAERDFFRAADPLGFILFKRNCESPAQICALIAALRASVDRDDAPVLIDQEGGRVARLGPPHWQPYPAAAAIGRLGGEDAREAAFIAARLIAADLGALGITIDCLPVLDVPIPGADAVIGDRAYAGDSQIVARLGRAACEGLLAGGVLPVIKHIPGHGGARVDSHHALPRVEADLASLEERDFAPFRALRDMPWAMTAHIVYDAIDPKLPATLSQRVIGEAIRTTIGFEGVLISDDLSMRALSGGLGERAGAALAAGCDLVLHCNGDPAEMVEVAAAVRPLGAAAQERLARAERRRGAPLPLDRGAALARLRRLMADEAA